MPSASSFPQDRTSWRPLTHRPAGEIPSPLITTPAHGTLSQTSWSRLAPPPSAPPPSSPSPPHTITVEDHYRLLPLISQQLVAVLSTRPRRLIPSLPATPVRSLISTQWGSSFSTKLGGISVRGEGGRERVRILPSAADRKQHWCALFRVPQGCALIRAFQECKKKTVRE